MRISDPSARQEIRIEKGDTVCIKGDLTQRKYHVAGFRYRGDERLVCLNDTLTGFDRILPLDDVVYTPRR